MIHATATHTPLPGACTWAHHSHGVELWCGDQAIPGGELCASCLIAWAAQQSPEYWLAHDRVASVGAA